MQIVEPLTPDQREILAPHLVELANLKRQAARQEIIVVQMLTLIKPEMGKAGSGWSFDKGAMVFKKTTIDPPELSPAGMAEAIAEAIADHDRDAGERGD